MHPSATTLSFLAYYGLLTLPSKKYFFFFFFFLHRPALNSHAVTNMIYHLRVLI